MIKYQPYAWNGNKYLPMSVAIYETEYEAIEAAKAIILDLSNDSVLNSIRKHWKEQPIIATPKERVMNMKINIGQLFVRKPVGFNAKNTYLVCGIIKTDEPLNLEHVHTFKSDMLTILDRRDVKPFSRGNNLDGVMTSPLWNINIHSD